MTKDQKRRVHEAGSISIDTATGKYRVCLISEGRGTSGVYPREFFTQENADALLGALSFPGHPENEWRPDLRNPLSAIGWVGEAAQVEIDPTTNLAGIWSEYHVGESLPEVRAYLAEFGPRLGLSVYIEAYGYEQPGSGEWIVTRLEGTDPYKSVDLVVAAGRGGKFDRALESLLALAPDHKASAPAEDTKKEEETQMDAETKGEFDSLKSLVTEALSALAGLAPKVEPVVEPTETEAQAAIEARIDAYDAATTLISESGLTESQVTEMRAYAREGKDIAFITERIEGAKKVLTEAQALVADGQNPKRVVEHSGGAAPTQSTGILSGLAGFGKVGG